MSNRTNAQEEKIATLQSVMNVIAILNQSKANSRFGGREFDLRPLLPVVDPQTFDDEGWNSFLTTSGANSTES